MCLIVKHGCKPEIAQSPIKCWKVVKDNDGYRKDTFWRAKWRMSFHRYDVVLSIYKPLTIQRGYLPGRAFSKIDYISEGFHAYTTKEDTDEAVNKNRDEFVVECLIPIESEYCYGEDNEIVTNRIMVHTPKTK